MTSSSLSLSELLALLLTLAVLTSTEPRWFSELEGNLERKLAPAGPGVAAEPGRPPFSIVLEYRLAKDWAYGKEKPGGSIPERQATFGFSMNGGMLLELAFVDEDVVVTVVVAAVDVV